MSRAGTELPVDGVPKLFHFSRRSAIFHFEWGGTAFAIKIWGPSTPAYHTAEAAYGWLTELRLRDPMQVRLPSVRPVALLREAGTIVMEWFDGGNIRETIARGDPERGRAGVVAAFHWLEHFHATSPPTSGTLRWQRRILVPQQGLERHAALIADVDRPGVALSLAKLEQLAAALKSAPVEFRLLHLDATCANFLFDGIRAIGIDLHEMRPDDPLIDYCNLLVDADALLNAETLPEPPFGIGAELQSLLARAPLIRQAPDAAARIRLHLLSSALAKYAARLPSQKGPVIRERTRQLAIAEALASDEFCASGVAGEVPIERA